jgi:two-component system, NarL family, sensor histidine kinase BarA
MRTAEGQLRSPSVSPASETGLERPRIAELLPAAEARELFSSFTASTGLAVTLLDEADQVVVGLAEHPTPGGTLRVTEILASQAAPEDTGVSENGKTATPAGAFLVHPVLYDLEPLGTIVVGPLSERAAGAAAHADHLLVTLDLLLHARQRAHYASSMHLASIEESYAEVLRKNAALEDALARLKELDHLKSSFLATVSHELRTPLTSIIGYSEMLAEGMCGPLTKEQLEFVQTIRQKGDQLLQLILSLLDLSKLESGTMRMHPIAVPIEAVLNDAVTTVGPAAAKRGVRISVKPGPPVPYIKADPDRLRQIFVNLADNAVKFTPKGGEVSLSAGIIEARSTDAGAVLLSPLRRELEIRVNDTGIGIPHHERHRIFDAFYQVDQSSTREQGGAGLGLAIVKRLVEAHQGRIRVEDHEPQGTSFVVTLPLISSSTSGARVRVEAPR